MSRNCSGGIGPFASTSKVSVKGLTEIVCAGESTLAMANITRGTRSRLDS